MVFRARETTCNADIRLGGSSSTGLTIFWGLSESFTGPHEENGMGAFCSTQARLQAGVWLLERYTAFHGCRYPWDVIFSETLYMSLLMPGG